MADEKQNQQHTYTYRVLEESAEDTVQQLLQGLRARPLIPAFALSKAADLDHDGIIDGTAEMETFGVSRKNLMLSQTSETDASEQKKNAEQLCRELAGNPALKQEWDKRIGDMMGASNGLENLFVAVAKNPENPDRTIIDPILKEMVETPIRTMAEQSKEFPPEIQMNDTDWQALSGLIGAKKEALLSAVRQDIKEQPEVAKVAADAPIIGNLTPYGMDMHCKVMTGAPIGQNRS